MGYSCHLTTTSRSCGPVLTGGCDLGANAADQIGYRGQPAREGYRSASARALCCGRRLTIMGHQIRGQTGVKSICCVLSFVCPVWVGSSRGFAWIPPVHRAKPTVHWFAFGDYILQMHSSGLRIHCQIHLPMFCQLFFCP